MSIQTQPEQFGKLLRSMTDYRDDHQEQRQGQAYFNALYQEYPEIADRIRTTPADPFYRDERIELFLTTLYAMDLPETTI